MTMETMTVTTAAPGPAIVETAPAAPAAAPAQAPAAAPAQAPAAPAAAPAVATSIDAAAPAAAPVAAPAAPEASTDAKGVVTYEPTGDPGLDLSLKFLGERGFGPDSPAMKAAEAGNFELLKAELSLMGDKAKGWEQLVALGERSFNDFKAGKQAAAQKTQDAILSVFGEDKAVAAKEWAKVTDWARENAEPHEKVAVNAALAQGGIAAKAMAAYLNGLYRAHPSAVIEPSIVTKIGGAAGDTSGSLSPEAYKTAIADLVSKQNGVIDGTPAYAALQARRAAWRPTGR